MDSKLNNGSIKPGMLTLPVITINKLLKSRNEVLIKHLVACGLRIHMCSAFVRAVTVGYLQIYFGLLSWKTVALDSTPKLSFISE